MASTDFRQRMMTIYRSSAEAPFAARSFDGPASVKPGLLALVLFYAVVIAIFALRITIWPPSAGQ